jgi:GTP-binding protein
VSFFEARAADGLSIRLVDLPGYGYAKRSKAERIEWGKLLENYLLERVALVTVVLLVDVRRGLEDDDRELLELVRSPSHTTRRPVGVVIAATKLDKVATSAQGALLQGIKRSAGAPVYGYSAKTHVGRPELWRALRQAAGLSLPQGTNPADSAASSSRPQSP